jgi:hypothetical protein
VFGVAQSQGAEVESLVARFEQERAAAEADRVAEVARLRALLESDKEGARQSIAVRHTRKGE